MTPEETALLALGGFDCSVCGKPLRYDASVPSPGYSGYRTNYPDAAYHGFVCCDTAHCVFCCEAYESKCEHLLAQKSGASAWTMPGARLAGYEPGVRVADASEPEHLLQPPKGLLQSVFGDRYPFVEKHYGANLTREPNGKEMLADLLATHEQGCEQAFRSRSRGWRHVVFSRDSAAIREAILTEILALRNGFTKLYEQFEPADAGFPFLIPGTQRYRRYRLQFSRYGGYFLLFGHQKVKIIDTGNGTGGETISYLSGATGVIRRVFSAWQNEKLILTVEYEPYGGNTTAERTHRFFQIQKSFNWEGNKRTEVNADEVVGNDVGLFESPILRHKDVAGPLQVRLSEDRRCLQFDWKRGYAFSGSLLFRAPITDYVLSPSGNAIAVAHEHVISLWHT